MADYHQAEPAVLGQQRAAVGIAVAIDASARAVFEQYFDQSLLE